MPRGFCSASSAVEDALDLGGVGDVPGQLRSTVTGDGH
jgi:hypothetical protein